MPAERVKHVLRERCTSLLPRQFGNRLSVEVDFPEDVVDHHGHQFRTVGEVAVKRGSTRFQALRQRPHRQCVGALLVDEFNSRGEDAAQR